jgi:uncharacterized membrane-anchored protein
MSLQSAATKVPAVTLTFWIIKILATTLGETAGDTVSMTMDLGYLVGTAMGDWAADSGLGYLGGALVFGAALALVAAAYFGTRISHVTLFWTAFILTRPLGATVGDFFDKPIAEGGLNVSRPLASAIIAVVIVACILVFSQRAGEHAGEARAG